MAEPLLLIPMTKCVIHLVKNVYIDLSQRMTTLKDLQFGEIYIGGAGLND